LLPALSADSAVEELEVAAVAVVALVVTTVEDPSVAEDVAGELVVVPSDEVAVCEVVTDTEVLLAAVVEFAGIGVASRPQPSAASETLLP